jgi:hypothetical protein
MMISGHLHPLADPVGEVGLVDLVCSHSQHGLPGIVNIRRIRRPDEPVGIKEEDERYPRSTLVPIGEGWFHASLQVSTAASIPVTCSASQRYSAGMRYRIT